MPEAKKILITGANSGIGKASAIQLAKQGHEIIMFCRSTERGEAARKDIIRESGVPPGQVSLIRCDLADLASVRAAAAKYKQKHDRLDVLLNNAGGYFSERKVSADGYEYTFAMNHLGHFLLTEELLPLIKQSVPARIVNVSSEASRTGSINFDDLMMEQKYSGFRAYCQAKLANIVFTNELAKRLQGTGVTATSLHPGVVNTNFGADASGFMKIMIKLVKPFMTTPAKGASTSVFLATSRQVEGVTGKYFANSKEKKANKEAHDPAILKRLWEVSAELVAASRTA